MPTDGLKPPVILRRTFCFGCGAIDVPPHHTRSGPKPHCPGPIKRLTYELREDPFKPRVGNRAERRAS